MIERIGKRIAHLRQEQGWTQQALAARLGISRVAISHIELDLTVPSERTIALLAGVFKCAPHELVRDTTYPQAKIDRLPLQVAMYTQLELDLALMENDLAWLGGLSGELSRNRLAVEVWERWAPRLDAWEQGWLEQPERALIHASRPALVEACRA